MKKILAAVLALTMLATPASAATISIEVGECVENFSQTITLHGVQSGGPLDLVLDQRDGGVFVFDATLNDAGQFIATAFGFEPGTTFDIFVTDGETVLTNTLVYVFCGDQPQPEPDIPITLYADASVCGQVTITATGFGIRPNETYQLVTGNQVTPVTAGPNSNTVQATFAVDPGWGNTQIRTVAGGYLASKADLGIGLTWYRSEAC